MRTGRSSSSTVNSSALTNKDHTGLFFRTFLNMYNDGRPIPGGECGRVCSLKNFLMNVLFCVLPVPKSVL